MPKHYPKAGPAARDAANVKGPGQRKADSETMQQSKAERSYRKDGARARANYGMDEYGNALKRAYPTGGSL